jgi:hypothetical protein
MIFARFHLAMDVIEWVPGLGSKAAHVKQHFRDKLIEHRVYVDQHGRRHAANPGLELAIQDRVPCRRLKRDREQADRVDMASDILTLNAGSSSLKFSLWRCETGMELSELFRGEAEKIGIAPHLIARGPRGNTVTDKEFGKDGAKLTHEDLLHELFAWISQCQRQNTIKAIGDRIVHGGNSFTAPVRIDHEVMAELSKLEPLAPLHQPHNLSGIRACANLAPRVPQVACFDTAFHHTMGPLARRLGLPRAYDEEGLRRYHSLHMVIVRRLGLRVAFAKSRNPL